MLERQNKQEIIFATKTNSCLAVMELKAQEMNIKGVGLIALFDNKNNNWNSKMRIMGALKNESVNFLSVAYSKAGEMVDTLQNSGTTDRTSLLGEFGFLGGVIKKVETAYLLAVFSGASGEEDTVIAQLGLDFMLDEIKKQQ